MRVRARACACAAGCQRWPASGLERWAAGRWNIRLPGGPRFLPSDRAECVWESEFSERPPVRRPPQAKMRTG
eukprot:8030838-Alexandrium_andersonii.AAC.1